MVLVCLTGLYVCMCEYACGIHRITSSVCDVMPFFSVSADGGHTTVAASSFNFLGTKKKKNLMSDLFAIKNQTFIVLEIMLLPV